MGHLVVANWKMNGSLALVRTVIDELASELMFIKHNAPRIVLCPPYPYLTTIKEEAKHSGIKIGAQDCSRQDQGSFTGDVSAAMLQEVGCEYVILGHSERRERHHETSDLIAQKVIAAQKENLTTIVCIGETKIDKDHGKTEEILRAQLDKSLPEETIIRQTIVAYEPVWAIGTGVTPTPEEVNHIHEFLHEYLYKKFQTYAAIPLLYGGSVKGYNAAHFMEQPFVNGVLVGAASLDIEEFSHIAFANYGEYK